jgi:hypothetical protein
VNQVNANANQETNYNSRSLLSDNYAYDIICCAFPSTRQANYSKASCAIRLAQKTCRHGECEHYRGKQPTKKPPKYGNEYKKGIMGKKSERVRKCLSCGEQKWITSRELCKICAGRHRYYGTIDQFPRSRRKGATVGVRS